MKPVTIGIGCFEPRRSRAKIRASPAVGGGKLDVGLRELIVGDDQVARVDERRRVSASEIGGDDQRREPFAEARRHVEGSRRAMPEQVDSLQRAAEFGQQRLDVRAHARRAPAEEVSHGRTMAAGDLFEGVRERRIGVFGQPGAIEQLIR